MKHQKWLIIGLFLLCFTIALVSGCFIVESGNTGASLQDFPDTETLSSWVENHVQPYEPGSGAEAWYKAALNIQREAASDGYLVSAVITGASESSDEYMVWCTAIAGGDLYWWHPEGTEPSLMFTAEELELEAD
ncbi:hypothetical protein ACFLUH_03835 [Chloroflexota bacterium]